MDLKVTDVSISDLFDQFIEASTMRNVLSIHHRILNYADLDPCEFNVFFPKLKNAVTSNRERKNWKAKALFSKIDKKANHKCYSNTKTPSRLGQHNNTNIILNQNNSFDNSNDINNRIQENNGNNALKGYNCLVIGSGPAGLRTAIELQLLGATKVVVVEKRSRFSRNNVLHLWPFVIDDLKSLGAKKFYGKFCAGSIDHISIRQLQLILLKICLMIGCDFRDSCSYISLCSASLIHQQNLVKSNNMQTTTTTTNGNGSDNIQTNNKFDSDSTQYIVSKCDLDDIDQNKDKDYIFKRSSITDLDSDSKSNTLTRTKTPTSTYQIEFQEATIDDGGGQHSSFSVSDSMKAHEGSLQVNDNDIDEETTNQVADDNLAKSSINQEDDNHDQSNLNDEHKVSLTGEHNGVDNNDELDNDGDYLSRQESQHLKGSRAHFQSDSPNQERELHAIEWDIIIGADGRRNALSKFFPRKEFRGRLAIAITANFINRQTPAEASVSEISGLSFIYNQNMFNALAYDTNIELENICYYKDDTHYFVMTAKKKSLLERGVLINDYATTQDLLSDSNVNRQALLKYAKDAAYWTTGLEPLDFALNHYGQEDCAMFDFTSIYAATHACKALKTQTGGMTLMSLVGDSLLEPFWPTGSGCARGFLSSFDAAWMCRQWSVNNCAVIDNNCANENQLKTNNRNSRNSSDFNRSTKSSNNNRIALSVIAERESIYRILGQTTNELLQQNYSHWTLNPHTRYPNLNRHSVLPSQVEHLISNGSASNEKPSDVKKNLSHPKAGRRVKSPYNGSHRRSPKKLKPMNNNYQSSLNRADVRHEKNRLRIRSRANHHFRSEQELVMDDVYHEFESSYNNLADDRRSMSGTLPSSNNLLSLEARRAREIDECLRQRRQKNQLSVVRDQLIDKFKRNSDDSPDNTSTCNAALLNELRKLREQQQSKNGKENNSRDPKRPLTLLNSIRRCASFAERVKSFENKLVQNNSPESTTPTTPRTPIDNVKNLPEFATLQEHFVNNSSSSQACERKPKMPIMKLSKDDWNVKCWEARLSAYKQRENFMKGRLSNSTKSLNKALSVDSYQQNYGKPEKQVEVFKSRIKEMADKLKQDKDIEQPVKSIKTNGGPKKEKIYNPRASATTNGSWVSHLRKELIKGAEASYPQQARNPVAPTKMIKKLFQDDDDDADNGKHYDHLCINRPTNKYLKNGYKGHLTRTRYDGTSKLITLESPSTDSKQAYMNALNSCNLSNQAPNISRSSPSSTMPSNKSTTKCFRCLKLIDLGDKIVIGSINLHKTCLKCANCGLTLQTEEILYHVDFHKQANIMDADAKNGSFACSICMPNLKSHLDVNSSRVTLDSVKQSDKVEFSSEHRFRSREEFLSRKINYNELYKNLLNDNLNNRKKYMPAGETNKIDKEYKIARSESIDGSEQVTLILPIDSESSKSKDSKKPMIDEDEFQRILHLGSNGGNNVDDEETSDENRDDDDQTSESKGSESSSLHSPQNSQTSTCDDISTSDEDDEINDEVDNYSGSDIIGTEGNNFQATVVLDEDEEAKTAKV